MHNLLRKSAYQARPSELSEDERALWATNTKRPSMEDSADWTTEDWKIYLTTCVRQKSPMTGLAPRELAAYDLGAEAYRAGQKIISCPWFEIDVPGSADLWPHFSNGWIDALAAGLHLKDGKAVS